jgi:hypothetical protein
LFDNRDIGEYPPNSSSFAQGDMRNPKALHEAKNHFFKEHKTLGKGKFDGILLSNVLNYFTD